MRSFEDARLNFKRIDIIILRVHREINEKARATKKLFWAERSSKDLIKEVKSFAPERSFVFHKRHSRRGINALSIKSE